MRRFTHGSGSDRKVVVIELDGPRMTVLQVTPDGATKRTQKELGSDAAALAASEQMAGQLAARGFVEQVARVARPARAAARASASDAGAGGLGGPSAYDDIEEPAASTILPRLPAGPAAATAAEPSPKKKKKSGGKKKRKKAEGGDALDVRVLSGIGAFGALILGVIGFIAYDALLKPPTIVGSWSGSMVEHEISRKLTHTRYDLILDAQRQASLTLQQKYTTKGTYTLEGDLLKLSLRDEEGEEMMEKRYRIVLGSTTLDLKDPQTGEVAVQLLRQRGEPAVGGKSTPALAAPSGLGEADEAADAALASVELAAKDSAFRLRYPKGWEHDTGSRPDNTYSWARFTKGSATIEVHADVTGSLMSGSDVNRGQQEEGSETAPVHVAHEGAKRSTAEQLSDYNESKPGVFKGAKLGEGRISQFTASGGGLFGSRLRGYRVTLLTNDRRISILCHCPEKEFAGLRPTFLAVCRSLAR